MPESSFFRTAFLGTGVIAGSHIDALQTMTGIEVAAVCDLDEAKARSFQSKYSIAKAYSNLEQMLKEVKPDVVHVLLPPTVHATAAETCLRAGSHVFVEKPFCVTSEECRQVERVAQEKGLRIGVNHNVAFAPGMLRAINSIRSGRIGAPEVLRVMYGVPIPISAANPPKHWMFSAPERLILELGPHPVSVICRVLGKAVGASTAVSGHLVFPDGTSFFQSWQTSLVCERGLGQIVLHTGGRYSYTTVHILGEDGEIFVDIGRNLVRMSEKTPLRRLDNLTDSWRNGTGVIGQSVGNFIAGIQGATGMGPKYDLQTMSVRSSAESFYSALRAGTTPLVDGEQGTAVIEACEMIIQSGLAFHEQQGGRGVE